MDDVFETDVFMSFYEFVNSIKIEMLLTTFYLFFIL